MQKILVENFLAKTIKIGAALILFTPLVMGPFGLTMSDYPKAVFFRSLVEAIIVLYLFLISLNSGYLPRKSVLIASAFLFSFVSIIASIAGINFYRSFWGDALTAEGIILELHLLAFFIIASGVFYKKEEWISLFKVAIGVSAVSSAVAILQQLGAVSFYATSLPWRVSGTLSNPDFFAPYIILSIFLSIFVIVSEHRKNLRFVWFMVLFLNCYALFFSKTRSAFIGLISGFAFLLFFYYPRLSYNLRKIVLFSTLFLCIFFLLISLVSPEYVLASKFNIFDRNFSSRMDLWEISLNAFKEKPILGWGTGSFAFVFDKFFKHEYLHNIAEAIYFKNPHNKVLEILVSNGILGLASYLFLFFIIFYRIFKYGRPQESFSLIIAAFFVAYFVQDFFLFDNICTYIPFFLVLAFVNNNFSNTPSKEVLSGKTTGRHLLFAKLVFAFFIALITAVIFYHLNVKPTIAASYFSLYIKNEARDPKRTIAEYQKATEMGTIYDKDLRQALVNRVIFCLENGTAESAKEDAVKMLVKVKPFFYKDTEEKDQLQNNNYEYLARAEEQIYLFYKNLEALDNMEKDLSGAISFNPEIPVFYRLMGDLRVLQNRDQEGYDYFKKASELVAGGEGNKIKPYKEMGIIYFRKGDFKKAINVYEKKLEEDYSKKNGSKPVIEALLPYIDAVALMYCRNLNDIESCRRTYERAGTAYPESRAFLRERFKNLKIEINKE